MKIIETELEFDKFLKSNEKSDLIMIPVYCNGNKPVYIDLISIIYTYSVSSKEDAVFVLNHSEGLSLPTEIINKISKDINIFVYGKKKFKRFINQNHKLIDMDILEYFYTNKISEDEFDTPAHEYFVRHFGKFNNLNSIIPIVKHVERCSEICKRFLPLIKYYNEDDATFKNYNETVLNSLFNIEKNGLFTHYDQFKEKFPGTPIYDGFVYSEYNPYTTTGRPSNRFGGINFAALNKENKSRNSFISRFGENGFMMSFDYDAYHIRLLADLVDYKFPEDISIHEYLGKYYFNKEELTEEEYNESKGISFRQLYGGIAKEYQSIPFFAKVHEYTQLIWSNFKCDGYIETPIFGRKLHKEFFTDLNAPKILNYLLQAYETERNMAIISSIEDRTQSFKSKMILYTYDSILIDFNKNDGTEYIKILTQELEQNGKFPVKIEVGWDYGNMKKVSRKF